MWFRRETNSIFYVESDYGSAKLSRDKVNVISLYLRVEILYAFFILKESIEQAFDQADRLALLLIALPDTDTIN